jgi:ubiquinone/menaquinone biosynthesis C-methylase UbiE
MTRDGVAATQGFYTRWAQLYDAVATRAPGVGRLRESAVAALAPGPGDVVVDLGCGTGANFPYLRERVGPEGTVVGVDFTPGMLARADARVRREGWSNVHVVRGDATRPPVERADAVFASFLVGMLSDPAAAVRDWASLVGAGGRLGLLDLARSAGSGRPLNGLFRAFVLASSPPGTRSRHADSPTAVLDRRVAEAHRTLLDACEGRTHETRALGFARLSAGRVRPGVVDRFSRASRES